MSFSSIKFNGSSLLMGISGLILIGFLVTTSLGVWNYLRLEEKTIAAPTKWEIVEKSSSQFAIETWYTFTVQGKAYEGQTTFSKPYQLNRISAEKQIRTYAAQPWVVWYQPSHPENSSLEHLFPLKNCLYTLIVMGVFFYFFYLSKKN